MPAEFGNQQALGNKSQTKYDTDVMAASLSDWAQKETSINLNAFCKEQKIHQKSIDDFCYRSENFAEELLRTRAILAERRERLLNVGLLNYGAWARTAADHDLFMNKFEKEKEAYRASLRMKVDEASNDELVSTILRAIKEESGDVTS